MTPATMSNNSSPKTKLPAPSTKAFLTHPLYLDMTAVPLPVIANQLQLECEMNLRSDRDHSNFFPFLFHRVLEEAESGRYADICSWQPHGRSFKIHDKERFESQILETRFKKKAKFSSFIRQLNLYGFHRLTQDTEDKGTFYHCSFVRGHPDLTFFVRRARVKGTGVRRPLDKLSEPLFVTMPPLHGNPVSVEQGNQKETKPAHKVWSSSQSSSLLLPFKRSLVAAIEPLRRAGQELLLKHAQSEPLFPHILTCQECFDSSLSSSSKPANMYWPLRMIDLTDDWLTSALEQEPWSEQPDVNYLDLFTEPKELISLQQFKSIQA